VGGLGRHELQCHPFCVLKVRYRVVAEFQVAKSTSPTSSFRQGVPESRARDGKNSGDSNH